MKMPFITKVGVVLASAMTASLVTNAYAQEVTVSQPFKGSVLASDLEFPWEITMGPDGWLWVTERVGKRVTRVNPESGEKAVAVIIDDVLVGPQHEGLLGLALHPSLLGDDNSNNFVYVAYTYDANPAEGDDQVERYIKVVRFTYVSETATLSDPVELIAGLPAGNDHNSGRLKVGPDEKLYFTIGDQGHNQFGNFRKPILSQELPNADQVRTKDWTNYSGKILRLNLDGSIPEDNPEIKGVRSHVFAYGFRNGQGIVFSDEGKLYQSEQGPKADDEINLIQAGGNYGWPRVAGYKDNMSYVYGAWGEAPESEALEFSDFTFPPSVPQYKETEWNDPDFVEPLKTFYTVPNSYNFQDPVCGEMYFICWPTIAPSSIDYYPVDGAIPGWGNSLIVTSLKNGALYRMRLTGDGSSVQGDVQVYFDTVNRYRDTAFSPDFKTIYVATDGGGLTRNDATNGVAQEMANPGAILQFSYIDE